MPATLRPFTSESVSEGHPDKICDQISDAVLDACLEKDRHSRVACECYATTGLVLVGGEISTRTYVDIQEIARSVVKQIGYDNPEYGLDWASMAVLNAIHNQSPDIAQGVDGHGLKEYEGKQGAGDQGMMFGFACDETPELLPLPYVLVTRMMRAFESCGNPIFAPDGKGQVTVEYEDGVPKRVPTVLMSNAIDYRKVPDSSRNSIEGTAREIAWECLNGWVDKDTQFLFNPTGEWQAVNSCSAADSGVTGRKLVVQLYGGYPGAQLGGGAVVNKSPEKVDCTAAFGVRHVAKNIVAAGLAKKCSVQLAYAIGMAHPLSIYVNTFGTGQASDERIAKAVNDVFDLTPRGMIEKFDMLRGIIYRKIPKTLFLDDYPWEKTDMVDALKKALS